MLFYLLTANYNPTSNPITRLGNSAFALKEDVLTLRDDRQLLVWSLQRYTIIKYTPIEIIHLFYDY